MIVNFSVQNYGPIKDWQTLSFEADRKEDMESAYITTVGGMRLLKLALIYGANASGKTTILKALNFLRKLVLEPETKKNKKLSFQPFLFDTNTPDDSSKFEVEFIQNEKRYLYHIEFTQLAVISEELYLYPHKVIVFKRSTDLDKQLAMIKLGAKFTKDKVIEKQLEANTLWNNTVLGGYLKTNIEFEELKEVTDWFGDVLNPIVYSTTILENYVTSEINEGQIDKQLIVDILKNADFNISDILIREDIKDIPDGMIELLKKISSVPNSEMSRIEQEKKMTTVSVELEHTVNNVQYKLPLEQESQGTNRYYGFAGLLALLIADSNVIPIDELEASLHPDLYRHFLLSFLMNAKQSQLIATTDRKSVV